MLSRHVLLLTAAIGVVGSNSIALSPISARVAESFANVDATGVMLAAAIFGLCTAGSALFLAPLADKLSAARAVVHACWVFCCAMALSAGAPNLWLLCVGQGLSGLAAGMAIPAIYTLAIEVAPKGRESQTLGTVLSGWTISIVAGVSLSALIADLASWRAVYGSLSLLGATCALLLWRAALPVIIRPAITSPLTALKVPGLWRALLTAFSFMIAFYGFYSYLGAHVTQTLGRSTTEAGLIVLSYGLGFGAGVFLDPQIDRLGPARLSLPVFAAIAVVYALIAFSTQSYLAILILAAFWGIAQHLGLTLIVGRMVALDPSQRGAILGLNSAVTYLSVFAGALAFAPLFTTYGLAGCALVASLALLVPVSQSIRNARTASPTS